MKRILKALAVAVAVLGIVAPAALGPAFARPTMSPEDWYRQIEGTSKTGGDHPWVYATIRRVNASAGTLTISHELRCVRSIEGGQG